MNSPDEGPAVLRAWLAAGWQRTYNGLRRVTSDKAPLGTKGFGLATAGLAALLASAIVAISACTLVSPPSGTPLTDQERAIAAAELLFRQKLREGVDMSRGPCLSEEIISDWAVDVAHSPRQPVDDLPENQCQSYRQGRTHHFVELDPQGKLIRAR